MRRDYHKWFSPRLGRDMELLVFGHAGSPTLVFPTRMGRFYDYENWRQVAAIHDKIEAGHLQLFCVDSVDAESFYAFQKTPRQRVERHQRYEEYLLEEVGPLIRKLNPTPRWIAHGCSIGAYHAVNLTFRHPELFSKVVGFSGRYDLTQSMGWFPSLFEGYYDDLVYFHTPSHFVAGMTDPATLDRLRALEITLAIGRDDAFYENNVALSRTLWEKGIWHALHVWEGEAHRGRYWRRMARMYL